MAYFSNGTEGMDYVARYCDRCVHQNGPDGKSGCAVWLAHLLYAYDECNSKSNAKAMLDLLIPVKDGIWPQQCAMFKAGDPVPEPNVTTSTEKPAVMPAMREWAEKHGIRA